MDQLQNLADGRLLHGCTYCDTGDDETADHVPSRVLLDRPFPTNLPVVAACYLCNNGFSRDEEYLACLLQCVLAGSTDPDSIRRPRIAEILRRSSALRSSLEAAKSIIDGKVVFAAEDTRVRNVVRKLAKGHAAFELSLAFRREPTSLMWWPMSMMTAEQRDAYEAPHVPQLFGEVGSRGMQRSVVTQLALISPTGGLAALNLVINDWVEVQEGRYRYLAMHNSNEVKIRIVLEEFLACEVSWRDTDADEVSAG